MNKHEFFDRLDHPNRPPSDQATRELADLLQEVETLESPDPGPDYWNRFNQRLQTRLDRRPPKRRFRRLWLDLPLGLAAAAALVLTLVVLAPWRGDTPDMRRIDNLDGAELAILSELYEPLAEPLPGAPAASSTDWDLLLELYEPAAPDVFANDTWRDVDPDELANLWNREG